MKERTLTFSINGDLITRLAREQCHYEGKMEYAINLLENCLESDEITDNERKALVFAILDGCAEITGTYPGNDYRCHYLDKKDERWNIAKTFEKLQERAEQAEKELHQVEEKLGFIACNYMSSWDRRKATAADGRINHGKGADEGSGTRSSLMWETIRIIDQMGIWKPKVVIWENVKNVTSKQMKKNFDRYLLEMERMGYTSNYQTLDAREFGLPQARERVFTISMLGEEKFDFDDLIRTPMRNIKEFLLNDAPDVYDVTQPSVYSVIGHKGIRRATVIEDHAFTITTRQDRTPAQVIDCGEGRYRYLTERECWRLQGYTDEDFDRAAAVQKKTGRYTMALYKQAGNSIPVPIFESIFRKIILNETEKRGSHDNSRRHIAAD